MLKAILLLAMAASALAAPKLFETKECTLWDIEDKKPVDSTDLTIKDSKFIIDICGREQFGYTVDAPKKGDIKFKQLTKGIKCKDPKKDKKHQQFKQDLLLSVFYEEYIKGEKDTVYLRGQHQGLRLAVTKRGDKPLPPSESQPPKNPSGQPQNSQKHPPPKGQPQPEKPNNQPAKTFPLGNYMTRIKGQETFSVPTIVNGDKMMMNMCGGVVEVPFTITAANGFRAQVSTALTKCVKFAEAVKLLEQLKNVFFYNHRGDRKGIDLTDDRQVVRVQMIFDETMFKTKKP